MYIYVCLSYDDCMYETTENSLMINDSVEIPFHICPLEEMSPISYNSPTTTGTWEIMSHCLTLCVCVRRGPGSINRRLTLTAPVSSAGSTSDVVKERLHQFQEDSPSNAGTETSNQMKKVKRERPVIWGRSSPPQQPRKQPSVLLEPGLELWVCVWVSDARKPLSHHTPPTSPTPV